MTARDPIEAALDAWWGQKFGAWRSQPGAVQWRAKRKMRAAIAAYEDAQRAELLRGFGDPAELRAEVEREAGR